MRCRLAIPGAGGRLRRPSWKGPAMSFSRTRVRVTVLALAVALIGPLSSSGRWATGSTVPANDLDPTFGTGGVVNTDLPTPSEQLRHLAIQADGKILALGDGPGGSALRRYSEDGSLESGFQVATTLGKAVAVHPSQRIILGGIGGDYPSFKFALNRRNTDGTADPTFGRRGKVLTAFAEGSVTLEALAVPSDGRIVAAGETSLSDESAFAFARYRPNGGLDPSFGTDGRVVVPLPDDASLAGLAIQADGKIVANGFVHAGSDLLCLVRLQADGTLDPTFGDGGTVLMTEFDQFYASGLAIQPDGSIVSGGEYWDDADFETDYGVVRHLPDGTLDTTFGVGGLAHVFAGGLDSVAEGMALQSNGLIVQAGWSPDEGDENEVNVVWWNPDGSLHYVRHSDLFGFTSFGLAVAAQADGKALVAGSGFGGFEGQEWGLARFLST
jgi:uncharacterized delta-60 repeat protein